MSYSPYLSSEPGYYQDNEWGIRLETILTVVPKETKVGGGYMLLLGGSVAMGCQFVGVGIYHHLNSVHWVLLLTEFIDVLNLTFPHSVH